MLKPTFKCIIATLVLLLGTDFALAKDYRIEVVLFENLKASPDPGNKSLYIPRRGAALGLSSGDAGAAGFSLVEDEMELEEHADRDRKSVV